MNTRIVDTTHSPHAALASVPLDAVRWTEGFWAERFDQAREVTARRLWERLADPEAGHVLDNFRIAAGRREGEHRGTWWQDAWLYKWIEAAACLHRISGDAWLDERMDEGVELIAAAQADDGYIGTQTQASDKPRFSDIRLHEVYNMGHLLTAAVAHRRMTGKTSFLEVAIRVADHLCSVLGVTVEPCFAHNPSAIMGLVELHRETGEHKHLDCAKLIVDARGAKPKPRAGDLWHRPHGLAGTDQIQDRVPLRESQEVVGHNVFFTYLFAGAADVFLETGDGTLRTALERLWADLTQRKININGGVSPMGLGLSLRHDCVGEAVGKAYFLPNADAYNETCGQIGNFMWNYRMLCADPRAAYADMMELEIYNGILSGMGLDGASWWYRNALRRNAADHVTQGHNDLAEREQPGPRRICCPTNLLRTVAQFQGCVYSVDNEGLWVHHYGGNEARLELGAGEAFGLAQETDYPWDGRIALTIRAAPERSVAVRLRIPGWAEGAGVTVNGRPAGSATAPGAYARVERVWAAGDRIELELPMPVRLMQAHPKVEHCRGQVAVRRGPILYCLESPDLPEGIDLDGVLAPSDADLRPAPAPDLPFGIRVLQGQFLHRCEEPWEGQLYRPLAPHPPAPVPVRLIPYFAWANRGPSTMSVWLPAAMRGP